jgi:sugar phosphate isomerase/epimerase
MKSFKIGIDSGSLEPLGLSPFEILDWAIMNEAEGVQFSGPETDPERGFDRSFLKELAEYAVENRLYLEWGGAGHVPAGTAPGTIPDLLAINRKAAETARTLGLSAVLSRSGGPARWDPGAPPPGELVGLIASTLNEQKSMLKDIGVVLAIEPGPGLSTFDLLRILERTGTAPGEYFGVCFDTLGPLAMLEDPAAAAGRLWPWIAATRIRDGGIVLSGDGFSSFPAETGTGVLDFGAIFTELSKLERKINLSLLDHDGDIVVPVFAPAVMDHFPDLGVTELMAVLRLAMKSQELLDRGKLAILDSTRWAEHGERRIKHGLRTLRRIVGDGGR